MYMYSCQLLPKLVKIVNPRACTHKVLLTKVLLVNKLSNSFHEVIQTLDNACILPDPVSTLEGGHENDC